MKIINISIIMIFLVLISATLVSADLMSIQGQVTDSEGNPSSGNLQVLIYDSAFGGNLIYNSSTDFNNKIIDGRYDVVLGSNQSLSLTYGNTYYMDLLINGEDLDFDGSERQVFQSNVGEIKNTNNDNNASGNYSFAAGQSSQSQGDYSASFGRDTISMGDGSFTTGRNSVALGGMSIAMGMDANASGHDSISIGRSARSLGGGSVAIGFLPQAIGSYSVAIGEAVKSEGRASSSFGYQSIASGNYSTAIGNFMNVSGISSIGIGLRTLVEPLEGGVDDVYYNLEQDSTLSIMEGDVGIGTTTPQTKLDVNGTISITSVMKLVPTDTVVNCDSSQKGSVYMDDNLSKPCFCNGTDWVLFEDSTTTC